MFIKELNILNFKNIAEAHLEFCPRFNCFVGNNGVGKTNILDAIYQLSMGKSYFNLPDAQNIKHGEGFFVLQGKYERAGEEIDIYCGFKKGQKKVLKRNQKSYSKLSEHIGLLPLVIIAPEDNLLIEGGSEERRKLINGIISQYNPDYLYSLIRYNKILLQRNSLLRSASEKGLDKEMLDVLDEQLAEYGEKVKKERQQFLEQFKNLFQQYYEAISGGKEKISLDYNPSIKEEESIYDVLKQSIDKDKILGYTTKGIHRDDLILTIDEYPVKKIGSQGQKKTFLIALKLAQYEWLLKVNKVKPLLLLDDIFDKLDAERVNRIIQITGEDIFGQIFITDTNRQHIDKILKSQKNDYSLFNIEAGVVN